MRLLLVQHGDANPKEVDPQRSLSVKGRADVTRVSSLLEQAGVRVAKVVHSGKKRAQQTAELLAASVGAGSQVEAMSGIDPMDSVDTLARAARDWTEDTMVVGHLPFMGKLVSLLVARAEGLSVVAFQPGTVVSLHRNEQGVWSIEWMLRPDLLGNVNLG